MLCAENHFDLISGEMDSGLMRKQVSQPDLSIGFREFWPILANRNIECSFPCSIKSRMIVPEMG